MVTERTPMEPGSLDADRITDREFTTVRRGFDPVEVRGFLEEISSELERYRTRIAELERELRALEARRAEVPAPPPVVTPDPLDPAHLAKLLGEETARVIDAAQSAATEIRTKAEDTAVRMVADATAEATRVTSAAEERRAALIAEADAAVVEIRTQAEQKLADAEVEHLRIVESARDEARGMIAETREVRERMLEDLARRRAALREQFEQLLEGRNRLAQAYEVVRENLSLVTRQLHVDLPEAKLAADVAALRTTEHEILRPRRPGSIIDELERQENQPPKDQPPAPELPAPESSDHEPSGPESSGPEPSGIEVVDRSADEPEEETVAIQEVPDDSETDRIIETEPIVVREPPVPPPVRVVTRSKRSGQADRLFDRLRQEGEDSGSDFPEPSTAVGDGSEPTDEPLDRAESGDVFDIDSDVDTDVEPDTATGEAIDSVTFIARRDDVVVDLGRTLARHLKRELSDEQNALLASLTSAKGAVTALTHLPPEESQFERYQTLLVPALERAAAAGAAVFEGDRSVRTTVTDLASSIAVEVVRPLRDRLERCFAEADGDRDEIAQRVRSCYREWKAQRVDHLAQWAVMAAADRGAFDVIPTGAPIVWVVADGGRPSPDCDDNALAGVIRKGEEFPTGHLHPPVHDNCHCLVVPAERLGMSTG